MKQQIVYQLQQVSVQYHGKKLFNKLDFTVRDGETWALVGPAGSGKSSLLKALAGELPVSGGLQILNFYEKYKDDSNAIISPVFTWRNLISFVDARHHFTNLSNTENFYYQQRYNSCDAEDAPTVRDYLKKETRQKYQSYWTFERTVERFTLTELLDKEVILLSNGETKRLLLAAALIKQPSILLLDNPLSGLDLTARQMFDQLLKEIVASGIHIVFSVSPSEIPDTVTHLAHLEQGAIRFAGSKEDWSPSAMYTEKKGNQSEKMAIWLKTISMPSIPQILELTNCRIQYGNKVILENINWSVQQGERWALLGHNGAGKSTLLSLITGDNPQAYANDIRLFGKKRGSGESIWDLKQKIGYVSPELFQYFPQDTTVSQAVESGLYDTIGLFRAPSSLHKEKVEKIMDAMGLSTHSQTLLRHTATSIQRICLVARALVKCPPLLILDEPCQGLDNNQIEEFKQLIDLICEQTSLTLIYVSHYTSEIPVAVTKKYILKNGQRLE